MEKLTGLGSILSDASNPASVIGSRETFSDKAFTAWKPTPEDTNNIAKNWSGEIENMSNAFFEKLKDKALTQGTVRIWEVSCPSVNTCN